MDILTVSPDVKLALSRLPTEVHKASARERLKRALVLSSQ